MMETFQLAVLFIVLGAAFLFFVKEWLPADLVALSAFALCIVCGMLGKQDITDVFQNPAPLTIGAMFILSAALSRTGVIDGMAHLFHRVAKGSELRALMILAITVLPLSACVNNTPVVVVFLPVIIGFARSSRLKASRLLIPLSFLSILGGTMTLFGTSTNILVSGVAAEQGMEPFRIFEITPLGIIYALVGVIYMFTVGRKLLPHRDTVASLFKADDVRAFVSTVVVPKESPLVGKELSEAQIWDNKAFRIFYVVRDGQRVGSAPLAQIVLEEEDTIVLKASTRGISEITESGELAYASEQNGSQRGSLKLVEVMVGPQSSYIGKTMKDLNLRQQHGVVVAALHRKGANFSEMLKTVTLQVGDTMLIGLPLKSLKSKRANG